VFKPGRGKGALVSAIAVLALTAIAGCGGGDSSSSEASGTTSEGAAAVTVESTSMTKAQYVAKAEKICTTETGKIVRVVQKAIRQGSEVKVSVVLPPVEGMLNKLVALGAPEGEEARVEAFLGALKSDLEEVENNPSATTQELAKEFHDSGELARKLGVQSCALG
jgi:hypothetical protein